jgi:hypothetical protein
VHYATFSSFKKEDITIFISQDFSFHTVAGCNRIAPNGFFPKTDLNP